MKKPTSRYAGQPALTAMLVYPPCILRVLISETTPTVFQKNHVRNNTKNKED